MEPKENDGRNPVGELQEMTQKRLWPPPVYEFTNEIGPAHAREFVCNVRLFNICEQGDWSAAFICAHPVSQKLPTVVVVVVVDC